MKLIDKDAVVAEIEKLKDKAIDSDDRVKWYLYNDVIKAINTLEVKEVDLEKEMDRYYGMYRDGNGETHDITDGEICFDWKDDATAQADMHLAEYFFELGLKVQKGEKV